MNDTHNTSDTQHTSDTLGEESTLEQFQRVEKAEYDLTLFVTGASALSARAVADVRALCETYLHGCYQLHIVDIHQDPELVSSRGVLTSPTLFKDFPLPRRVVVGALSDTARVLSASTSRQWLPRT